MNFNLLVPTVCRKAPMEAFTSRGSCYFRRSKSLQLATCLLLGMALANVSRASEGDWPQWRGPQRDGQVTGPAWPDKVDTNHLRQIWRIELGPSYSGPIISEGRIFTTATLDKKAEVVLALDQKTGKQLWSTQWEGAMSVPFFAKANGDWIRSTPACDGERLYVAGMRDVLVCLDAKSGKELWRYDFVKKHKTPNPDFGFVCSPLVDGDAVYVQAGASFAKLDKLTGELAWRTLVESNPANGSFFSSPVFAEITGKRQLLVQTREKLAAVNPADGSILWEQPVAAMRGMNILTPVSYKDTLFTSTYGGKTIGYKVTDAAGKYAVEQAWTHKAQGYMSTPVVIDGVAYHLMKSQRLMAIEVETGKELWTSDESFGQYWSMIAQGDKILGLDQRGILFLLHANREKCEILDRRKLGGGETWAHLAISGDELYVRELNSLTAYRWTAEDKKRIICKTLTDWISSEPRNAGCRSGHQGPRRHQWSVRWIRSGPWK